MQNIVFEFKPQNSDLITSRSRDCIFFVHKKIWQQLSNSTQKKTLRLVRDITNGISLTSLGGQVVKSNPSLIRFRIGRSFRLVLSRGKGRLTFRLCRRQGYEAQFKRF
ncbi:hypothetical protein [Enterovibrio makurazakiensis]|uniref:ParE family toxin-like protein n=1 Tax=Enterovibrio makurazakiensis TaxID=2910232 RepID=UPI003D2628AA